MAKKAVNEADRERRKDGILASAAGLFGTNEFDEIRMADIAEKACLAKGTLFLYFSTKEELFLELLMKEYGRWFDDMNAVLTSPAANPDWKTVITEHIVCTIDAQEQLFRLVAILHSVLERNIGEDAAVRFKKFLSFHVRETGGFIESVLPNLKPGDGAKLLVQLHALIVGFSGIARPAPALRNAIERENLTEFMVDFRQALAEAVKIFINGL